MKREGTFGKEHKEGSRFAVLEVEEAQIEQEENSGKSQSKVLREVTNSREYLNGKKEGKKRSEKENGVRSNESNRSARRENQSERKDMVEKLKKKSQEMQEGPRKKTTFDKRKNNNEEEIVVETNMYESNKGQKEVLVKDLIDLGDYEDERIGKEDMEWGGQPMEDEEDDIECTGIVIEVGVQTPSLAVDN